MIAFIDEHRAQYGSEWICRVPPIARAEITRMRPSGAIAVTEHAVAAAEAIPCRISPLPRIAQIESRSRGAGLDVLDDTRPDGRGLAAHVRFAAGRNA